MSYKRVQSKNTDVPFVEPEGLTSQCWCVRPSFAVSVCPRQCIFPVALLGRLSFSLSQKLIPPPPHNCHRFSSGPERAASAEGGGEEKTCRIGYLGRLAGHQGILGSLLTWLCDSPPPSTPSTITSHPTHLAIKKLNIPRRSTQPVLSFSLVTRGH